MGKNKKSFLTRTLIFFVAIFAFIALICQILCAINPYISPKFFVWTSYFGLAFWPIFIINVLLFVILLFLRAGKSLFICILALIIAVPGFMRSCSINEKKIDEGNLKIMTYNVAHYRDIANQQKSRETVKNDFISLIIKEKPDIVCLQESGKWNEKTAAEYAQEIGCKYYSWNENDYGGNIIFSKFFLEDDAYTKAYNAADAAGFMKLVKAGSRGTFYLGNSHLQSYSISKDEIEYIGDTRNYVEKSDTGKSIIRKLKDGFESRTNHTKALVSNLPKNGIPIIICGDFNDTPLSYTYQQMRKAGFEDSFVEAGRGVGKTYCGKLPMLRIDYVWHGENINVFTYKTIRKKISDHYPVVVTLNVSN